MKRRCLCLGCVDIDERSVDDLHVIDDVTPGPLRRVLGVVGVVAATFVLVAGIAEGMRGARRTDSCPSVLAGRSDLGRLAVVDGGQLRLVDLTTCRSRTLVGSGVSAPARWSADGRYLAYGDGRVVSSAGGQPTRPLGRLAAGWGSGSPAWVWSPTGHALAGVTIGGGLLLGGPGAVTRRLLPDGWGATSIAWSPNGRTLAVSRSLYLKAPAPYHQEIWLIDLDSGTKTLLLALPKPQVAPPWLSGFSPDGSWLLFWEDSLNSASLAADGVPLMIISVKGGTAIPVGTGTLMYGDFVSWCTDNLLAYVLNRGGRQVTLNDRINLAGSPNWQTLTPADPGANAHLSFISPACSPPELFMIAAAVGPSSPDLPFGHEHRTIGLLSYTGGNWHPLEPPPPAGSSDELPLWSSDGRWIAFIRTTPTDDGGVGRLYLLDLGERFTGKARLVGPIANVGVAANYYGHYDWSAQVAWYSR
jgi:dipeptidyl aminopeptidase/acylaminoacyl peptidase